MTAFRDIYCCACEQEVSAVLVDGTKIYPHRPDLAHLPFWLCLTCDNYVGCHHKTKDRIRPLGCIPSPEIKRLRRELHAVLDPIWKSGAATRSQVYQMLSDRFGKEFHVAEIRTVEEGEQVLAAARNMEAGMM